MARHRVEALAHLLRQGLAIEGEFGLRPLEALLGVARTVEESVYDPRSFVRTAGGLDFSLRNPPLRCGAFSELRVGVDGTPPSADGVRVAVGPDGPWRPASDLSARRPLELHPGVVTRFEVERRLDRGRGHHTVRLELRSVAIPPLVWLEFTDTPRGKAAP